MPAVRKASPVLRFRLAREGGGGGGGGVAEAVLDPALLDPALLEELYDTEDV